MVTDLDNGLVLSQVPHNCFPTGIGRGQDVLNLPVPGHDTDIFSRLKEKTKAGAVNTNLTLSMGQTKHKYSNYHKVQDLCHANNVDTHLNKPLENAADTDVEPGCSVNITFLKKLIHYICIYM